MFEALVVTLVRMSNMPVRQVGALLGVTDTRLWRSLAALVDQAMADVDMSAVDAVGIGPGGTSGATLSPRAGSFANRGGPDQAARAAEPSCRAASPSALRLAA